MHEDKYQILCERKLKKIVEKSNGRKIWIYGAGKGGRLAAEVFSRASIDFSGFVDKKSELLKTYNGHSVVSLGQLNPNTDFLVIAFLKHNTKVEAELDAVGFLAQDYIHVVSNEDQKSFLYPPHEGSIERMMEIIDGITEEELEYLRGHEGDDYLQRIFWQNRDIALTSADKISRKRAEVKCSYISNHFAAFIPISKDIQRFFGPHGFKGIFISQYAKIGNNCTIFQNVTIGSNTLEGSGGAGFPVIGNNVFIGAGATIVGNVTIGDRARIGAGCTVTRSVPADAVIVAPSAKIIQKAGLKNEFTVSAEWIKQHKENDTEDAFCFDTSVLTDDKKRYFDQCFRLTFAGDLILLEEQVKRGYGDHEYNYDDVFKYAAPYIQSADLAIGVFEGPMGGPVPGYSNGNCWDGKELHLNYPDAFGQAVKRAGFSLVTTANNHLLDRGSDAAKRTLQVLDQIGLEHIGSYLSAADKEKNRIKIIEKDGIRFGVLAYTYGANNAKFNDLWKGKEAYITSLIGGGEDDFDELRNEVQKDFDEIKKHNPDLIIVLPHIGTQLVNYPDENQRKWFEVFREFGADIILGDHPHAVQPIEWYLENDKTVFCAYCPGNFANFYRKKGGDTSILIDIYIDRRTKKLVGGSIVPLYTESRVDGNYRALPIYDIIHNESLRSQFSTDDYERVKKSNAIITQVVFGKQFHISNTKERYYFDTGCYLREKTKCQFNITEKMRQGKMFNYLLTYKKLCFVGDSITDGTMNGGYPWYEPLESVFDAAEWCRYSRGGCTVSGLIKDITQIPDADLYVIAIGTNDVRYRKWSECAMTSEEYIAQLDALRCGLKQKNLKAAFCFIAPWHAMDGDPYTPLKYAEKTELMSIYTEALLRYCQSNESGFINPNPYICEALDTHTQETYLVDHIHPNAEAGINLYAESVLRS